MLERYFIATCPSNDNRLGQQLRRNIRCEGLQQDFKSRQPYELHRTRYEYSACELG